MVGSGSCGWSTARASPSSSQLDDLPRGPWERREVHPFDTFERGGHGGELAKIAFGDLDTGGEGGFGRVVGQRTDLDAGTEQMIDHEAPDVAGRSGHQDFHSFSFVCKQQT